MPLAQRVFRRDPMPTLIVIAAITSATHTDADLTAPADGHILARVAGKWKSVSSTALSLFATGWRLPNATWGTARNAANTADVPVVRLNASNQVEFGAAFASAYVNVLQINRSDSVVQTLVPNGWNTVTHNRGATSAMIFAFNGDYGANQFTVSGIQYLDANSFRFWAAGGWAISARINWFILG